jgi:hypothetical protein
MLLSQRRLKLVFFLSMGLLLFISFQACKHPADLSAVPEISFSGQIQPLIIANCSKSGCHGESAYERFPLTTYDEIIRDGQVIPGQAHGSNLYDVILNGTMPQDGKLSNETIQLIYVWIEQGAKNN